MIGSATGSGPTVINVWLPDYPATPLFLAQAREMADEFGRAHPEYRVDIRDVAYQSLPGEVAKAVAQGRPPTIVQFFFTSSQTARDLTDRDGRPLFASISRALAGRDSVLGEPVVLPDLVPAVREYYEADDGLHAVPLLASTALMYVNVDLLAAAGIDEVPRTWAEVSAAAAAVVSRAGGPAHAITWPNSVWLFLQAVASQGGLLADHDNGRRGRAERVFLDSPPMLEFARWWQQLHRDGLYLYSGHQAAGEYMLQTWEENFQAFAQQRVALVLSSSVDAERMARAGVDGGFEVRAVRMPHNGAVPFAGNVIGGDALWLADGLDDATRDGALAFMQYLLRPAHAIQRHQSTRFIPITRTAYRRLDRDGWFDQHPYHRVAVEQLEAGDHSMASRSVLVGDFAHIIGTTTQAMEDVLLRGADPVERFAWATAEGQRLLDEYNDGLGHGAEARRLRVN